MCGIAGILTRSVPPDRRPPVQALDRMLGCLHHRGPDSHGVHVTECRSHPASLALGHTRLAILDPSPAGYQPMVDSATGNVVVSNGEIYNFRELRRELDTDDRAWASETDTEVILRAYARWGRECVHHLRGMFAFAIWDAKRETLFLARDRLGIKPLYYYARDGCFAFASEVRSLLASGVVARRLDPIALDQYLAYQTTAAPRTMIRDVHALRAATWLTVDARGDVREGTYWDPLRNRSIDAAADDAPACRRRVGALLREATALHLVSDVPLGAFLSGGIDSSAVVALMSEVGPVPRTFSVVFGEAGYDESRYARLIATRFRTDHTEIALREGDLLAQLPDALAAMDQPTGDGVNTYVVSRAVRAAGITVALSGLGGDELFAGYPVFSRLRRSASAFRLWGHAPHALRRGVARAVEAVRGGAATDKLAAALASDGSLPTLLPLTRWVFAPSQRRALLAHSSARSLEADHDPYVASLQGSFSDVPSADLLAKISYAEATTYMHDVLLRDTDQMSMAHALEVRVPLLDHKLVEYVMGVPAQYKWPNGTPKRLLSDSLHGLLPEEIVHRPKQGFVLPFSSWMRGALRSFCEARLGHERVTHRRLFRPEPVRRLWDTFVEGRSPASWSRVWLLVVLEDWLERNAVVTEA